MEPEAQLGHGQGRSSSTRQPSYSSSSSTALSSRKSSSNDTSTTIPPSTSTTAVHEDASNSNNGASRTRKLSVVSFTSAEYNKNDDQWEEEEVASQGNRINDGHPHKRRLQHRIAEEEPDLSSPPSSPSSGYSTSSSSSSSSSHGCCTDSANRHGHGRGNANGRNKSHSKADRERRRRARDRKLLRNQQAHHRPTQLALESSFIESPNTSATLSPIYSESPDHQYGPIPSCYGGSRPVSAVSSQNLGFPELRRRQHSRASPPSIFGSCSPNHTSKTPRSGNNTKQTAPSASHTHWIPNVAVRAVSDPNRDVDNISPNGFHRHSLSNSSAYFNSNHHDHHLHKRRRRHDYNLPEIHFLTPPPPPPPPPASEYRRASHQHSLSATSAAELLSSASLHTPGERERNTSNPSLLQPSPIRPAVLKGRSLSTPAGGVEEFYSPLHSINTSPKRENSFTDSLRELWNRQSTDGCLVYDMTVNPSVRTFAGPITTTRTPPATSTHTTPSVAPPIDLTPQLLKSLAVPIRDSPPESLRSVHLLEVLDSDPRPTFLLGTASTTTTEETRVTSTTIHDLQLEVVYHNDAFSSLLPDAAFSTSTLDSGQQRTTFNITDPRYHRWISSSFSNTSIRGGKCRPYVCPDGILWTQNAFSCPDGTRMVLICGVPLPSTNTKQVHVRKGEICPPHVWERAMEAARVKDALDDDDMSTLIETDLDSAMVISPSPTPQPEAQQPKALFANRETRKQVEVQPEEMDTSGDAVEFDRKAINSTVYSPHLPSDFGFFDWTRLPASIISDQHIELVRAVDWAATGFGAIETWPQSLRTMMNLVLSSPHPAAMYWGADFSVVYNEPYIPLIGAKHPSLLGRRYQDGWSEIWDAIEPFFMEAVLTGKPTNKEDDRLFVLRNGFREETYFSWSICPIIGEDGTTIGLHNPAFEKTRRVIAERRMLTLREVGERCGSARDVKSFWRQVLTALETNPWDAPFAVLYSCKKADSTDSEVSSSYASSLSNTRVYSLEGTIGVPDGHPAAPSVLDLKSNADGFSIAFREALEIEGNIFLSMEAGTLPADLMEGIDVQGFSEDMCTSAVVCPINPSSDTPLGFLVLGINPRRPFDEDYRLFIQLLTRQLTTSVASVVLYEEEIRRAQRAARLAALDRVELSQQLAIKSKEAEQSELKFTRLAEFAPVGVFIADFQGKINYHNEMFSEISCHPKNLDVSRWLESVHPADAAKTETNWNQVINEKKRKTWEFRWKTPWMLPNHLGEQVDRWTLFSASPELDADGMLLGVFGSITNISETKFAEDLQKRRVEEVVEMKRQQDNFVDMASHEMRNPLSAIMQGADAVLGSLERYRDIASSQDLLEDIESSIDVAQTISLCALHQKRVVDDILTMSKLDSALLTVTPVDVQPIAVVERAFKMFEQEAISSETKMTFKVDDSYRSTGIDWVRLDPARLLQVLINLLTNALKFLRTEPSKSIIVTMGSSVRRPSSMDSHNSLVYFPSTRKAVDLTTGSDWGSGEPVFLTFSVLDTGKGLTEAEKKNLFQKFSQATAKTEVSYGGSGLGLFICKELVHLQSGEIGVQSEAGKGCVFSFYVKCRRSTRPEVEVPQAAILRPVSSSKRQSQGSPALASPINEGFNIVKPTERPKPVKKVSEERPKLDYNVLIVEDNLVNQKLLRKALENAGCTTFVANHGIEALDKIKQTVYWRDAPADAQELSLILMDVEMPEMDGLTCSRRIRELQADGSILGHIPIIAVTANARQAQIDRMFAAGMDDVVSKPYRIKELIPKLHSVVSKYRNKDTIGVDEE